MTTSKEATELAYVILVNAVRSRREPQNALAVAIDKILAERDAARRVAERAAEWELRARKAEAQLESAHLQGLITGK